MSERSIENFGFLIHDAARLLRRRFEITAQDFGLSAAQWRAIVRLVKHGPMTQAKLAEILEIEPISVSRLIDRMEQSGWAERRPDETDRRVKMVFATKQANTAFASIKSLAHNVFDSALDGLDDIERSKLIAMLEKVVSNLTHEDCANTDDVQIKRQAAR